MTAWDKQIDLPTIHWLSKVHKTPIGCCFIVASRQCSTKSHIFKMIYCHVEGSHNKIRLHYTFNHYSVAQFFCPIVEKLTKINHQKNAKTIFTFDSSTFYTTIPHILLIQVLFEIFFFFFNYKKKSRVVL